MIKENTIVYSREVYVGLGFAISSHIKCRRDAMELTGAAQVGCRKVDGHRLYRYFV